MLIAGHGARQATGPLRDLAERLNAPVLTTFKAKGLVPDTHPLGAGVLGRSGTPVASWLMNEADLLIVVGASFANHTGIAPYKPILQVDDSPAAIGRFDPVGAGITGDAALTLTALLEELGAARTEDQRPAVAARWAIWRAEKARRAADERGRGVSAAAVFDALSRHLPHDAIVTVDVGNHAYSLGRYLESSGQPVLMSGYLGSIGFGYPAALGAWAAAPGRPVVAVTGDGGFGQYAAELTTAVKYGIGVKHVLLDNHSLGKISKEQLAADFPVWHTSLRNPDWAAYAELCGATGIKADCRDQLDQAMTRLFAVDGPALLCTSARSRTAVTLCLPGLLLFGPPPAVEVDDLVPCLRGQVLGFDPAGQLDRLAHLGQVLGAVRAARQVRLEHGWNAEAGAFTQAFGGEDLDASNLMLVITGFLPGDDPRMKATIDATAERLTDERGLVYRYLAQDGLAGEEGTFLLCTFWLAQAQALAGETAQAVATFERAVAAVNDVGLLAEEIDADGEMIGNFPQAFSHIGLVNAAWAIAQAQQRSAGRLRPPQCPGADRGREQVPHHPARQAQRELRVRLRRDDPGARSRPDGSGR